MSETEKNTATRHTPWLAAAGLIALQAVVLGWMVWDNESLLSSGREIILDVEPVDPRSLFRGDYVILRYKGLDRLDVPAAGDGEAGNTDPVPKLRVGSPYGVILAPAPDAAAGEPWVKVRAVTTCRLQTDDRHACLMGTIKWLGKTRGIKSATVNYGIENYFVPEGAGRDLENAISIEKLQVIVAVDGTGHGLIKGLIVDGRRIADEGLF